MEIHGVFLYKNIPIADNIYIYKILGESEMLGIIFSVIAGAAMSILGVMNTRLGEKIGVYEANVIIAGLSVVVSLIALWIMGN